MVFGSSQGRGCCFCCVVGPNSQKPVLGMAAADQSRNIIDSKGTRGHYFISSLCSRLKTAEQKDDNREKGLCALSCCLVSKNGTHGLVLMGHTVGIHRPVCTSAKQFNWEMERV